jgi:hypothetical protein
MAVDTMWKQMNQSSGLILKEGFKKRTDSSENL